MPGVPNRTPGRYRPLSLRPQPDVRGRLDYPLWRSDTASQPSTAGGRLARRSGVLLGAGNFPQLSDQLRVNTEAGASKLFPCRRQIDPAELGASRKYVKCCCNFQSQPACLVRSGRSSIKTRSDRSCNAGSRTSYSPASKGSVDYIALRCGCGGNKLNPGRRILHPVSDLVRSMIRPTALWRQYPEPGLFRRAVPDIGPRQLKRDSRWATHRLQRDTSKYRVGY
jgi:hypothetical protein